MDLIFGDPHFMPHPIRLIGNAIAHGEKIVRRFAKSPRSEMITGTVLAVMIILFSTLIPWVILWFADKINPWLKIVIEALMCYQILAVKALKKESMKVYYELEKGDLKEARNKVSMIVGRDTKDLNEEQVTKAAVETVAENTSDGTVAPLLFIAIGGAPLGFFYKAVNTLDSMIGYRNDEYLYFGRFAAKLDDVVNFIPARIAAYFMIIAAFFLRMDWKNAYKIFKRDRYNHDSPNSAQTESVCAGALQIQLAGDAFYFGKRYPKKTIGDALRRIVPEDIIQVNRLLYGTAWLCVTLCILIRGVILWIL